MSGANFDDEIPYAIPVDHSEEYRLQAELLTENKSLQKKIDALENELNEYQTRILSYKSLETSHATIISLMEKYISNINLANDFHSTKNFTKAIEAYNSAINVAYELHDAYIWNRRLYGELFPTIPTTYVDYVTKLRLAVVNCLIQDNKMEQAYDYLHSTHFSSINSEFIKLKKAECRSLISQRAQQLFSYAYESHEVLQIQEALDALTEAERLLNKISQAPSSDFIALRMQLEWKQMRDHTNSECNELLISQFSLSEYRPAAEHAQKILSVYSQYKNFLSVDERSSQARLTSRLSEFEQVAAQVEIDSLLLDIDNYLIYGDLPNAQTAMQHVCKLATRISNPDLLAKNNLGYQDPEYYSEKLRALEAEARQFIERAQSQSSTLANKIIDITLYKMGENTSLFEKDLDLLKSTLTSAIQKYWYKFDKRDEPTDLIHTIANKIVSSTTDTGIFTRWYNWTAASTKLKDQSKCAADIMELFKDYAAKALPGEQRKIGFNSRKK